MQLTLGLAQAFTGRVAGIENYYGHTASCPIIRKFILGQRQALVVSRHSYMKAFTILALTLTFSISCVSFKRNLTHLGSKEVVINNALMDFSNSIHLYKKGSVFSVWFYDTLYKKVLEKRDSINYAWINSDPYNNIVAVSIGGSNFKHLINPDGTYNNINLPSRYIEIKERLFYWWDDDYPFSDSALLILKKYGRITMDPADRNSNRDKSMKKGTHYYFCRNNLSRYKKKITKWGIGYYKPPKSRCN